MQLRSIADLGDLRGKRVITRVDFNVPIARDRIRDGAKVDLAMPTIIQLRAAGARVVLLSHLGDGTASLAPVARHLARVLGVRRAVLVRHRIGTPALTRAIAALRNGDVALLENIRAYPGEERNAAAFARSLAALGSVYVNEAFAVCHRNHASVVRLARALPSAAGPLLVREVEALAHLLDRPAAPFIALMGGAKITTKMPVIAALRMRADVVLLGGALVNGILAAKGYGVGDSFVERDGVEIAHTLLRRRGGGRLLLPADVVIGRTSGAPRARVVPIPPKPSALCGSGEAVLDIGPETIRAFSAELKSAATIVWNGPMGMFERPPFHHGSVALARVIASRASSRAFGVVGGGETLAVLAATGMTRYIDHVSTGGGAMLAFLAGEELPGLAALRAS